ncbi:AP2 domain-containing protein [Paucilactobacillus sp. N302-9]
MSKLIDISGQKFGRLTVLSKANHNSVNGNARWLCRCDCGRLTIADSTQLRKGIIKSCGCYRKEVARKRFLNNSKAIAHMGDTSTLKNADGVAYASLVKNRRNQSGVIGVSFDKQTGRWFARLMYEHKYVLMESFTELNAAIDARKNAEQHYFHKKAEIR